jgi:hypothetical protein
MTGSLHRGRANLAGWVWRTLAWLGGVAKRAWLTVYLSRRARVVAICLAIVLAAPPIVFVWAGAVWGAEVVLLRVGPPIFLMLFLTAVLVVDLVIRVRRRRQGTHDSSGLEYAEQPLALKWWLLAAAVWVVVAVFNILLPAVR